MSMEITVPSFLGELLNLPNDKIKINLKEKIKLIYLFSLVDRSYGSKILKVL